MSRASVLARGQAAGEAGMVDTCEITRSTGSTTDPFSGVETATTATVYTGKCRVQQSGSQAQQQDVGEAYVLLQNAEIQLPISAVGLQVGDLVTITAAGRDPDLVDRAFRIRDLMHKTDATARRVQVQEVTG